jgi:hypothetical protein
MLAAPVAFDHGLVTEHSRAQQEPAAEDAGLDAAENAGLDPAEEAGLSADERAELERLRAETAELRRQAGGPGAPGAPGAPGRRRHFSWRTPVSIVLIVLGCVLGPVAVLGVWAGNEVSDTGRWVATVQPLISDPAIQNVLTDKITNEVVGQLNLSGTINQASAQLNNKGLTRISSLLTTFGPQITSAVTGYIHSIVHTVISSQAAARIWTQVNTVAHQSLVKVLSGQGGGAVSTSNGQITLNLGPFIAEIKQDLIQHGFSLASNIPPVSPTIALFQAKDLGKAQAAYRLIKTLKIVLPILVLVLLAAGVWVARGRRRALIGAGLGLAASMLVLAIGLLIARSIYLNSVPSSVLPADAAAAAFDAMVYFIKVGLRVVLAVGLVVALGAFITGPSRTAIQIRSGLKSGLDWIRNFGERRGVSTGPVGEWTYQHRRGLRIGAVALIAVIFVFWGHPTGLVVILLVVILLVLLGLIELIGRPPAPAARPTAPA